jgi:hypothetical protein
MSSSSLVQSVAYYGVNFARCDSIIGKNDLFSCDRHNWSLHNFAVDAVDLPCNYFLNKCRSVGQLTDDELAVAAALMEAIALYCGVYSVFF